MKKKRILITGVAGFIGFHAAKKLQNKNFEILGVDSINNYYSQKLKKARIKELLSSNMKNFTFLKGNLNSKEVIKKITKFEPSVIIHLAAQAGVRHSIDQPHDYVKNNITATLNLFEMSKSLPNFKHLIYASTSSVYGLNETYPLSEDQTVCHPMQFYAVTKTTTELMAHSYASLFGIPSTGLRFFTVYGPWGRPDMALFKFTKNIIQEKSIDVYGYGKHIRAFTYVDDVVDGILRVINKAPKKNLKFIKNPPMPGISSAPYQILNIGGGQATNLLDFINEIEKNVGKKAKLNFLDIQPGDILKTEASTSAIEKLGYKSRTNISDGVKNFVDWYISYHKLQGKL